MLDLLAGAEEAAILLRCNRRSMLPYFAVTICRDGAAPDGGHSRRRSPLGLGPAGSDHQARFDPTRRWSTNCQPRSPSPRRRPTQRPPHLITGLTPKSCATRTQQFPAIKVQKEQKAEIVRSGLSAGGKELRTVGRAVMEKPFRRAIWLLFARTYRTSGLKDRTEPLNRVSSWSIASFCCHDR
jgi:hypothetical protein